MKKLILLTSLIFLSGCVSIKYNNVETIAIQIDYPPIGESVTVYVGDQLVQKGIAVKKEALSVNKTIDGFLYNIPAGTYNKVGNDEKYDYFSAEGIKRGIFSDPFELLALGKTNNSKICVICSVYNIFRYTVCYNGDYEIKTIISESETLFKQTLIYNGRVGNKINIGYREFSNKVARPAFNNDVEYDLSTSSKIGYKGAEIEVIRQIIVTLLID